MTKRVAILGMGRWGRTWKRVLGEIPGVEVVGDDHLDTGGRRPDYADVIAATGLDAVIITLPVGLHVDAIRHAVERGIPVLCEKPLVATRAELGELVALVDERAVVVRVSQNYRSRGWVRATRTAVADLGAVRHVSIAFAQPEFLDGGRDALPHPLLDDMAIHHMDLLRHLTDSEARVLGAWSARPEPTQYSGETDLDAVLRLSNGALVSYAGTWAARGATTPWDGDWEIRCDGGTVHVQDRRVLVETSAGDLKSRDVTEDPEDADLAAVWVEFAAALDGDPDAGVSVADNARSLSLVFDLQDHALRRTDGSAGTGRGEQK